MGFPAGGKHTDKTREKMSATRKGRTHSEAHKAALSAALKGKPKSKNYPITCPCGVAFMAGRPSAKYCSRRCSRAARGHGIVHAPEFAHFERACAVCGTTESLVGDHDHATGMPRGILCRNHNVGLGYMNDSPEYLRAAADYLERHEATIH